MALGAEVVDLIRLHLLDDPDQVGAIDKVAVMEHESRVALVWILVQVIDPTGVEAARSPLDAMHLVALLQQQLRQVTTVLPRDTGDRAVLGEGVGMEGMRDWVGM